MKVFRKIRQSMLKNRKVSQYLIYAIGEIVLVMIGILLALQVNNWNEERKLRTTINGVLKSIANDLETDTLKANSVIDYYKENQKNSNKILTGEINSKNYKDCPQCMNLVTIYRPFNVNNKGFERLSTLTDIPHTEKDSLIIDISSFYSLFLPLIEKNNNRMEDVVMKNFTALEDYPWFVDMAQGKFNQDLILYFTESEDYKKRVASHSILAVGNHLNITQQYKENATELINRINHRLDSNN